MTIARLIADRSPAIITCTTATPVHAAIALLAEKRIGALPVVEGERVVGIFSERDVITRLAEPRGGGDANFAAVLRRAVGDLMTAPPVTVTPETGVLEALALMTRRRVRHLPVVEAERMVGFVSIGDLVKYRIDRIEAEAAALREYIQAA